MRSLEDLEADVAAVKEDNGLIAEGLLRLREDVAHNGRQVSALILSFSHVVAFLDGVADAESLSEVRGAANGAADALTEVADAQVASINKEYGL